MLYSLKYMFHAIKSFFSNEQAPYAKYQILHDGCWYHVSEEDYYAIMNAEIKDKDETGTVSEGYEQLELPGIL
jgi:hypothetical protein